MTDLAGRNWKLLIGDVRDRLRDLPDAHFHCCVTSPPYFQLRDYGIDGQIGLEQTPEAFVAELVAVFGEVRRVLRDDGTVWLNLGDSYAGGGGFWPDAPSNIAGKSRQATRTERKKGGIAVGNGLKQKDLVGIPWRVAFALQADGWYLRSDIIWAKPNPMPESVTDRPTKAHEYIFLLSKSPRYFFDAEAVKDASKYPDDNRKARQSAEDYESLMGDRGQIRAVINPNGAKTYPTRNIRSVWNIATQSYSEAHFACVDAETECLTLTGWKRHNELRAGDVAAQYDIESGCLSWGAVESVATYEVESQPMVSVQSRDLSMLLTPNHRTIISRRHPKTRHYQPRVVIRADELKTGHAIPVGGEWSATASNAGIGESMAELLGWYVAEGYERKSGSTVDIYQSLAANPLKVDRIRHLLTAAGASFTEAVQEREWRGRPATMVCFTISGDVAVSLRRLSPGKSLAWGYLGLPENEIARLLRGLVDGDGHTRKDDGRLCFIQKNKSLIDLVQALAIRLGYSTRVSPRKGCETFALYMTKKKRISLRGTGGSGVEITESPYTGIVWCPKLPQGTWVARRHGRVFITGNTFPEEIPARCIKAGTSEKGCCPECGKPWERVTERDELPQVPEYAGKWSETDEQSSGRKILANVKRGRAAGLPHDNPIPQRRTTGWQPGCECGGEPVPCRVLEPFAGSGTTLKVAVELGREAVGVELNPEYAAMAQRRITNPRKWAAPDAKPVPSIPGQRTMFEESA